MDYRRYYVIGAATGEQGPFDLEELADALRSGLIGGGDQVRTALGTRVGSVDEVLAGAQVRRIEAGHDSGGQRRLGHPQVLVLVIVAILIAIGFMAFALRPSDAGGGRASTPGTRAAPSGPEPAVPPPTPSPAAPRAAPPLPASAPAADAVHPAHDPFAGSSAHYALRRVQTAYPGPLVRVKRDSDGQELDIGALADGALDAQALTAFCRGSANGSVARWYDQGPAHADLVQPVAVGQPHIVSKGQLGVVNKCAAMHFKRPERWMDAIAAIGIGTVLVVLTSDEKERFGEFETVLASASASDHAYLRGAAGTALFDAMKATVKDLHIDGVPGFACTQFGKLKVVDAELSQPIDADILRLGNDAGWTSQRGWHGSVCEVVIFPSALTPERRRAAEEALARHFAITLGR